MDEDEDEKDEAADGSWAIGRFYPTGSRRRTMKVVCLSMTISRRRLTSQGRVVPIPISGRDFDTRFARPRNARRGAGSRATCPGPPGLPRPLRARQG